MTGSVRSQQAVQTRAPNFTSRLIYLPSWKFRMSRRANHLPTRRHHAALQIKFIKAHWKARKCCFPSSPPRPSPFPFWRGQQLIVRVSKEITCKFYATFKRQQCVEIIGVNKSGDNRSSSSAKPPLPTIAVLMPYCATRAISAEQTDAYNTYRNETTVWHISQKFAKNARKE